MLAWPIAWKIIPAAPNAAANDSTTLASSSSGATSARSRATRTSRTTTRISGMTTRLSRAAVRSLSRGAGVSPPTRARGARGACDRVGGARGEGAVGGCARAARVVPLDRALPGDGADLLGERLIRRQADAQVADADRQGEQHAGAGDPERADP